jgi:hypothetical protein
MSVGTLVIAGVVAHARGDEEAAVPGVLAVVAALVPAIVAHGAVSTDLRSGVALLWLQKPVSPLRFYAIRALDVIGMSILMILALSGGSALLTALFASPEAAQSVLTAIPMLVLMALSVCVLVVAFSSWGTSLDALLAFFFFYLTVISMLEPDRFTEVMRWVGFPVEPTATIGRFFSTGGTAQLGGTEELNRSVARFLTFLATWTAVAAAGVLVTTRSPLPRETAR